MYKILRLPFPFNFSPTVSSAFPSLFTNSQRKVTGLVQKYKGCEAKQEMFDSAIETIHCTVGQLPQKAHCFNKLSHVIQLLVQLLVQLNYIIISYLYIGPRCLSKFITFGSHFCPPSANVTQTASWIRTLS